jgi:hypothetical protein
MSKQKYSDYINTNVKSSYFDDGDQFYLQSNVTIPQGGFLPAYVREYRTNSAYLLAMTWISMMIPMICIFLCF